jgi:hypothetical protein
MFGWLRDALANTSPSPSYRRSMIPTPFFHQQKQKQQQQQNQKKTPQTFSPFDDNDDDGTDEELNDNSFYHNPYHSSGQMNYADLPQQQYTNQHNYPTYLAQQQTSNQTINQSIDHQIHTKLLSLQQRGNQVQSYPHRQYDYAYRNRLLSTHRSSFISNKNKQKYNTNEQQLGEEEEEEEKDNDDDGIPAYYPGEYPNLDEHFDFASVVLWYRNVMQSVKKFM